MQKSYIKFLHVFDLHNSLITAKHLTFYKRFHTFKLKELREFAYPDTNPQVLF